MTFAVWSERPPFAEADLNLGERIWQVGDKWIVTDQGLPTQEQIDLAQGTDHADIIKTQIALIETTQPLTQRAIRELMLVIGQAFPSAQASIFYQKAAAQEQAVAALRAQL